MYVSADLIPAIPYKVCPHLTGGESCFLSLVYCLLPGSYSSLPGSDGLGIQLPFIRHAPVISRKHSLGVCVPCKPNLVLC